MDSIMSRWRETLSPEEQAEITACARRLKNWVAGGFHKVERVGRPKKFFGTFSSEVMEVLARSMSTSSLDLSFGYNHGLFYDGRRAWRAYVRLAYAKGFYWVGAQRDDARNITGLPCPVAAGDLNIALEQLAPDVKFGWSVSTGDELLPNPWMPRGLEFVKQRTFFGLSISTNVTKNRIFVGTALKPTDRCSSLHLRFIGLSALPIHFAKSRLSSTKISGNWFRANELSLKRVAEMSSEHLKRTYLEKVEDPT